MPELSKSPSQQRRQSVRVNDLVRLRVTMLHADDRQAALERLALERMSSQTDRQPVSSVSGEGSYASRTDFVNRPLVDRLAAIEAKLDALLTQLAEAEAEKSWGDPVLVDLSAGGLLFPYRERLPVGAMLRLDILMRTTPPRPIITAAEVVRVAPSDSRFGGVQPSLVGVRFIDLDPEDRDRIAKRVFEVQRALLRRQREEQPASDKAPR